MRPDNVFLLISTIFIMIFAVIVNIRAARVGDRTMAGKYVTIAILCVLMGGFYVLDLLDVLNTYVVSFWLRILFATQILLVASYPALREPRIFKCLQATALHALAKNMNNTEDFPEKLNGSSRDESLESEGESQSQS